MRRIRDAIYRRQEDHLEPIGEAVIYLGRSEFYDLLLSMRDWTPVHIEYVDDVRRVTFHGLEVIEVCLPKYLRVA
ncbi:hypothetical protein SAMN03159424_04380 [Pseudomonas sp. NFACC05-1]|nr:hypothetical protein SAMN03159424_04380 [Pseudomonas sp. NFACC05-1]